MTDSKSHPKVSVIVPNYNHARFLRERLDSIYNQTFQDFEVILLDDASTDNSVKILREYAARPRTRLVLNEQNSGSTFAQWNKGVGLATGEYIWLAESDDVAEKEFLAEMVSALEGHPDVTLAHCDSKVIDEKGGLIAQSRIGIVRKEHDLEDYLDSHIKSGAKHILSRMVYCNAISNASAVLFRRSDYEAVGGADSSLRLAGDKLLWIRLLERGDYYFEIRTLNAMRTHTGTVRASFSCLPEKLSEECAVLQHLVSNHPISAFMVIRLLEKYCTPEYIESERRRSGADTKSIWHKCKRATLGTMGNYCARAIIGTWKRCGMIIQNKARKT